ncbi:amino acid transporter LysE [Amylibacter ulvae]|uniref:Amino acid transporter LysE n=1 Tax=Paramylibacter ulvae TaxID=1651968 RepID=A0ABQ3CXW2_9RHOB|nr:LysE family transporter [Amylibacter ulvae]GHA49124.1 amino acid transporter LysE [Amylibacter ulvae]
MTALLIFIFLGLFSPGPNVIMLTASGANFGMRKTLPHLFGVVLGVGIIGGATGLGLGTILQAAPQLEFMLKLIAAGWILWMAFALLRSAKHHTPESVKPFTFSQAVLFQWVNPKVWAVAIAGAAYVTHLTPIDQAITLGLAFSGINLGVCLFWTYSGDLLSRLLKTDEAWFVFRIVMAVLLAATILLILG